MRLIKDFFKLEAAPGILLFLSAVAAIIIANSSFAGIYEKFLSTQIFVGVGDRMLAKPALLWINDGMMTVFFFLVTLELKREFMIGHLSKPEKVLLPCMAAIGGIIFPALIFLYLVDGSDYIKSGWAIPAATDIAFAMGVLSLCGNRIPKWAKVFLLTLAIVDDLGVILIIALFYSANISTVMLSWSLLFTFILVLLNRTNVRNIFAYASIGALLWFCMLKSGVHATIAGVIGAALIPYGPKSENLEHELHPVVAFVILPLFAFANSGISLEHVGYSSLAIACAAGLVIGKQAGVMIGSFTAIWLFKNKVGEYSIPGLYGLSALAGIGFTMSIFISSLAYEQNLDYIIQARTGVLAGSMISAIIGFIILRSVFASNAKKS